MLKKFYFNSLSTIEERHVYNDILQSLKDRASYLRTGNLPKGASFRAMRAVVLERPDIYYFNAFTFPAQVAQGFQTIPLEYFEADDHLWKNALDELCKKINNKLSDSSSDYDTCKTIYDELANSISYDMKIYSEYCRIKAENKNFSKFIQEHGEAFSPYGVLINKKGVCQGISKLFKILCDKLNLQCACVEVIDKETHSPHMLNIVEIDGKSAFVDVTNGLKTQQFPAINYALFLRSKRYMEQIYKFSDEFEDPENEDLSFYAQNKTIFSNMTDLRRYLCSYRIHNGGPVVQIQYNQENPIDDQLNKKIKDTCDEILLYHCATDKSISSICKFGTYAGIINDFEE